MRLVADWCRDGVEAEAELMAKDRRDPRHEIQVDVRGLPGLDPPNVGVWETPTIDPTCRVLNPAPNLARLRSSPTRRSRILARRAPRCLADSRVGMRGSLHIGP